MLTVGTFDLKTHLSALLARVEAGEEIIITKRGKPVAHMKRIEKDVMSQEEFDKIVGRIKELRKGMSLGGLSWKELRDEGRK